MNYNIVRQNYQRGLWSVQMVKMALDKGVITETEFAEIVGQDIVAASGETTEGAK